ncbi:MAG: hypothetical protein LBO04_03685 [Spirochaetaceae bacterium]|nr:hypothetical protein [Spirochaetaceae bacterium]
MREQGDGAVIHGNAGRHPVNTTNEAIREKIVALKKSEPYRSANFTRFREPPEEQEQIQISYTGLSGILKAAGIAQQFRIQPSGALPETVRNNSCQVS